MSSEETTKRGASLAQDILQESLTHYGVKGMKWGVRRSDPSASGPTEVSVKTTPGKRVQTSGGKGHVPSEDAIKAAISRQKAKSSTSDSLSNNELKDLVKRMQLEQQYAQLMGQRTSGGPLARGQKFVKNLLGIGNTANQVIAFQNSPAGQRLREQLNRDSD